MSAVINKNSFILYKNYYEILNELPNEDMGILFRAILSYQATDEIPDDLPLHLKFIFKFIKNQFDLDDEKYYDFVEKQTTNGKKGGRPKLAAETSELENEPTEEIEKNPKNPKNPWVFSETQKTHNDNVNVNENENENLSLLNEREENFSREERENYPDTEFRETISKEDEEILETYVRRKKLAQKNVRAYVRKIIANGDHTEIIERERSKLGIKGKSPPEERIKTELVSICDKKSAFKVLARYYNRLEEFPPELEKIAEQYNLNSTEKMEKYSNELFSEKKTRLSSSCHT